MPPRSHDQTNAERLLEREQAPYEPVTGGLDAGAGGVAPAAAAGSPRP